MSKASEFLNLFETNKMFTKTTTKNLHVKFEADSDEYEENKTDVEIEVTWESDPSVNWNSVYWEYTPDTKSRLEHDYTKNERERIETIVDHMVRNDYEEWF